MAMTQPCLLCTTIGLPADQLHLNLNYICYGVKYHIQLLVRAGNSSPKQPSLIRRCPFCLATLRQTDSQGQLLTRAVGSLHLKERWYNLEEASRRQRQQQQQQQRKKHVCSNVAADKPFSMHVFIVRQYEPVSPLLHVGWFVFMPSWNGRDTIRQAAATAAASPSSPSTCKTPGILSHERKEFVEELSQSAS